MKFLCAVHVCFCVDCERGCVCVHLAHCIIKARALPRKKGGLGWGGWRVEEDEEEGGEARGVRTG